MALNTVKEIKSKISCRSILNRFWPGNFKSNGNSICPLHADSPNRPSLAVYPDHVHCFGGCGRSYDVIDLYEHGTGLPKANAIKNLANELGIQNDNGSRPSKKKESNPFTRRWKFLAKNTVSDEAKSYLEEKRGLKGIVSSLEKAKLVGFDPKWKQYGTDPATGDAVFEVKPALAFPVFDWKQTALLGIQFIPLDGTDKKFVKGSTPKDGFFVHGEDLNCNILAESVIDCLSIYSAVNRISSCRVTCLFSASTIDKIEQVTSIGRVLFMDDDAAGIRATVKALLKFGSSIAVVDYSRAPEGFKDPNELLVGGHADAIERMVQYAQRPASEDQVKEFVKRLMDRWKTKILNEKDQAAYDRFADEIGFGTPDGKPKDKGKSFALTQYGNTERMVSIHGGNMRYCYPSDKWFVWDGHRWSPDSLGVMDRMAKDTVRRMGSEASQIDDNDQRRAMLKHALKSEARAEMMAMIAGARSEPGIPVLPDEMDADHWVLNTKTGIIDLKTGGLIPHEKDRLITKLAPVEYIPGADCPAFKSFLDKILQGNQNLIAFLQRAIGSALTGITRDQCVFILHGEGANGKSTLLEVLHKLLGDFAVSTQFETFLAKTNETVRNDIARLKGARLVSAAESSKNKTLDESVVKQMTGDDRMSARFLFKEYFEFTPTFKIFLATNHKPKILGTEHAIWRRIRLVPFEVVIPEPEQDKSLTEKLEKELPGILNWAIEGCLLWQRDGLGAPEEVVEATNEYRTEMDPFGAFLDECCVINPLAKATSAELYDEYSRWVDRNKSRMMPQYQFGIILKGRGFKSKKGSKGKRVWMGIGRFDATCSGGEAVMHATQDSDPRHPCQVIEIKNKEGNKSVVGGTGGEGFGYITRTQYTTKTYTKTMPPSPPKYVTIQNNKENIGGEGLENLDTPSPPVPPKKICQNCLNFSPSTVNLNGSGVCLNEPWDGKLSKLPGEGGDCKNWTVERGNKDE